MKKSIFYIFLLILILSFDISAQENPAWMTSIEEAIKTKEKLWKIESNKVSPNQQVITLISGKNRTAIQIDLANFSNFEESFEGLVISFDKTMGKNERKVKLENFGDEAFLWSSGRNSWTMIMLRKKNIFADIFMPSEEAAKRFAKYVVTNLP